ncbi:hypothetical protein [Rhizobium lusitanum]|uniref:hypothetical protein n=1 Tax=Rhizobium lusitanum TaxID=293958 RepID=UPI0019560F4C|nr:hypothetical protein [Rhizobium lusitanum]MBM7045222.1 hypothetical protein [Rhizobium lusitanum]
MPRKFRQSKRRQATSDAWLAWAIGEHIEQSDPRWAECIIFEYIFTDDDIEALWRADGERVVAAWVADYPGTRPELWWRFDASEDRRTLDGREASCTFPRKRNGAVAVGVPATYESQAAYLDRLGLLPSGERKRLSPADYEPEVVR